MGCFKVWDAALNYDGIWDYHSQISNKDVLASGTLVSKHQQSPCIPLNLFNTGAKGFIGQPVFEFVRVSFGHHDEDCHFKTSTSGKFGNEWKCVPLKKKKKLTGGEDMSNVNKTNDPFDNFCFVN